MLLYLALAATFYGIAVFFVEGRTAFIAVFGLGFLISLTAELMFWFHIFRLPWKRQRQ